MWTFWGVIFLVQKIRRKSWVDLFVPVALFSVLLMTLVALSVPHWVIVALIIVAHLVYFVGILVAEKRLRERRS